MAASTHTGLTLKVAPKGGVSVYGLQRYPVTLYAEQWDRLLDPETVEAVRAFVDGQRKAGNLATIDRP
jgi:hypothetical protein